jgi:cytochrome P450
MLIVAKCLFNTDVASEADSVGAAITSLLADFNLLDASPLGPLLAKLPTPRQKRRAKNEKTLNTLVYRFIEARRASGEDTGDLLSMLLQSLDTEGDGTGMDDQQVRDEIMTLFLAGHETTANALSWTFYLLAQNPKAERRLHAELDSVLGNRPPTLADLPRLPYTKMVFSESLRLFPPAWVVGRTATAPDHIGGYTIPKGATVLMSQYLMHRHPVYWDQPDQFKPERFESETDRPRYAYFPFGGGPRLCIGEPFAWMEGELLIATLAQQWRFKLAPGAMVEPDPSITLRPKYGLPMVLKKR